MTAVRRTAIVVLCVVAVLVALKFVVPTLANTLNGIGIEIPLPAWLFRAHPILVLGLFFVGLPLLVVAIVVGSIYRSSRTTDAK